jgi:hypothetical protein
MGLTLWTDFERIFRWRDWSILDDVMEQLIGAPISDRPGQMPHHADAGMQLCDCRPVTVTEPAILYLCMFACVLCLDASRPNASMIHTSHLLLRSFIKSKQIVRPILHLAQMANTSVNPAACDDAWRQQVSWSDSSDEPKREEHLIWHGRGRPRLVLLTTPQTQHLKRPKLHYRKTTGEWTAHGAMSQAVDHQLRGI